MVASPAFAQQGNLPATSSAPKPVESINGVVLNADRKPVAGATVRLTSRQDSAFMLETSTDATGAFLIRVTQVGSYMLQAEHSGSRSSGLSVTIPEASPEKVALVMQPDISATQAMEFADQPSFAVAGVTDWTAVGGHGSDTVLRTSEDLVRQTLALKSAKAVSQPAMTPEEKTEESWLLAARAKEPRSFTINHRLGHLYLADQLYSEAIVPLSAAYEIEPLNRMNEYDLALAYKGSDEFTAAHEHIQKLLAREETADLHRVAGEVDERLGDPLSAVQQYELAARMDPSEQNYFAWGSELSLHRAVREAVGVFRNGVQAHPKSARMLAALGAALFASASYDEAALRLCEASDLDLTADQPYLLLGKAEAAAPAPLPCAEEKLARFARLQPDNAYANYLYAMAIWKRQEVAGEAKDPGITRQAETLLTKALSIDQKCSEAYLQAGIIYADEREYDRAASSYEKAIDVNPKLSEAHYRLAVAYDRLGERAKARSEFQLHAAIEKEQTAAVERQRREVKQFQIVLEGKSPSTATP